MLDRWSSYTVRIVWEFAWAGSVLVVLGEWSSYRNGRLNRSDCMNIYIYIYILIYIHTYIYIYIYIHTNVYIFIYVFMHVFVSHAHNSPMP